MRFMFNDDLAACEVRAGGVISTLIRCATIAYLSGVDPVISIALICAYAVLKLFSVLSKM